MPAKAKPPTDSELKAILGSAGDLWSGIVHAVEEMFVPLDKQWKPSKAGFGRMCLLQHKKRTLLYITPDKEKVWLAIVLGERAYGLAHGQFASRCDQEDVFRSEAVCRRAGDSFSGNLIERHSDDCKISGDQDHAQMNRQ